ncbi:hypothetical protein A3A63_01820 [Candidatus Gottesmanbacteria bacterium RIFCSPLOWO2_01_FULL_46_9]|uniref:Glycosyltransferase RgtA/B/C/D-like domain-containing protein n=1 Tax=Candidatus Gottesmanbacteria bacterium RIFCSPLOWO2_01_FULL_46_9 TaxID=1798394 RepID=A0A1F6AX79_9BACT|nr:MAG: hypothetical protein A3A63_01820 [Candidatus Gottesmanbacteria bacterium RIFCSPLOWO2_01_FULL_46_9]
MSAWLNKSFFARNWFLFGCVIIFCIALYFRFTQYYDRLGLASDQARDALIAREALRSRSVPLFGPFSSAGNFTTGPIWYWWLILSTALFPHALAAPWIILSLSYVGIVLLLVKIGEELEGKLFALIVGLFAAVSPAQIVQSLNNTNPSLVALFATLSLYFAVLYSKHKRLGDLFWATACVALAIGAHLQAMYLLVFIPFFLLTTKRKFLLKATGVVVLGLLLPSLPYILADMQHGFYNLRGIVDFALYGQYKIYIPNRWLTYLGVFWPETWGYVIGGFTAIGYMGIFLTVAVVVYTVVKRKIKGSMGMILVSFIAIVTMLRFYRGERFGGYFVFTHPLVIVLTAWSCFVVLKVHKYIGICCIVLLVFGSIYVNYRSIQGATNISYDRAKYWAELLIHTYPDRTFTLYITKGTSLSVTLPLVLYLDTEGKIGDTGIKIGFGGIPKYEAGHYPQIKGNEKDYALWELESSTSAQLREVGWENVNPSSIYRNATQWYKNIHEPDGLNKLLQLILSKYYN